MAPNRASSTDAPVWVLLGHKAGDNSQVLALAESLGVPFAEHHFRYRPTELLSNLLVGPNLLGIRAAGRATLVPPWPRLVITAGRRNEPVARWIRQQSGQRVRLVHVGRPWADPADFDLIVTTPQYDLAGHDNVLRIELPLRRAAARLSDDGSTDWAQRLAHLPRPYIAVLVGGESGMYQLDADKTDHLAAGVDRLARELGGSLLVTTSPRSPRGTAARMAAALDAPAWVFDWRPDAGENPYDAFLGLADRIVVTGESMSMLAEACDTRRPVYIFDMHDRVRSGIGGRVRGFRNALRYRALTHYMAQRFAPRRMRRDVGRMHEALIGAGRAAWLGGAFPDTEPPPLHDTDEVTRRVRALL